MPNSLNDEIEKNLYPSDDDMPEGVEIDDEEEPDEDLDDEDDEYFDLDDEDDDRDPDFDEE